MSYLPTTEARCYAAKCALADGCERHKCEPGRGHPVEDFSRDAAHRSCGHFIPVGTFKAPEKVKPGPRVHEPVRGLS